jgi:hypothetical protein
LASALLGMIGSGLSLFGGLEGLISGANAERQAEQAAQNAITSFESSSSQQYYNLLAGGTATLNELSGGLNNALVSGGKSLGAAMAGAGVYNSSATAGAIANQAAADAGVEGQYSQNLATTLATQKNQSSEQAAQMQYGLALNNLNYARQQYGGSMSGLGNFFGQLGQMNFGGVGGTTGGATNPTAPGAPGAAIPPTNGIVVPSLNQYSSGYSANYGNGTLPAWGNF